MAHIAVSSYQSWLSFFICFRSNVATLAPGCLFSSMMSKTRPFNLLCMKKYPDWPEPGKQEVHWIWLLEFAINSEHPHHIRPTVKSIILASRRYHEATISSSCSGTAFWLQTWTMYYSSKHTTPVLIHLTVSEKTRFMDGRTDNDDGNLRHGISSDDTAKQSYRSGYPSVTIGNIHGQCNLSQRESDDLGQLWPVIHLGVLCSSYVGHFWLNLQPLSTIH